MFVRCGEGRLQHFSGLKMEYLFAASFTLMIYFLARSSYWKNECRKCQQILRSDHLARMHRTAVKARKADVLDAEIIGD